MSAGPAVAASLCYSVDGAGGAYSGPPTNTAARHPPQQPATPSRGSSGFPVVSCWGAAREPLRFVNTMEGIT